MCFRLVAITLAAFFPLLCWGNVVIHEIHYNPEERGQPLEFVELLNAGERVVDLSGWQFDKGFQFAFPKGTSLAPGKHVLVAEDPQALAEHYGVQALGPWEGKLSNAGETLTLRDSKGKKVDEVDYGVGFPWPTAAAGAGASMELIHPDLDNDLGGSWRSSIQKSSASNTRLTTFVPKQSEAWRYFKGSHEPPKYWRAPNFNDKPWRTGQTPIGYDDGDDLTVLNDMINRYQTVFLRHTFQIAPGTSLERPLQLRVYCDDGAVLWINGREAARLRVIDRVPSRMSRTTRNHEAAWETVLLHRPRRFLKPGKNVLAILAVNGQINSSDFSIDASLVEAEDAALPPQPSPGLPNHTYTESPPPQIRQVTHRPLRPMSGQDVTIAAKVSDPDGVAKVSLQYQRLLPGDYISKEDPRFESDWETLPMTLRDKRYTVTLPSAWQKHRQVMRYRIVAEDEKGAKVRVPYEDDAQSNFAYYCYDGAPAWTGADEPGRTQAKTFPRSTMNSLPILHLIANAQAIENSQYKGSYNEHFFQGTLVVGNRVYDHIRFRNRGETTTYAVGKNKWRINFNRTHELPAHTLDRNAEPDERRWKRLNLNPGTVPYHRESRGNAVLNERLAFRLYQLAGIPSPDTCYTQLRVIDEVEEAGPNQYAGDLWGLYMGFEAIDGFMLDNHEEPDGEIIRVKQMGNTRSRSAPSPAPEGLDYETFWSGLYERQSVAWWERMIDLDRYYSFHAVSLATVRMDQKLNHNYMLYRHPEKNWQALPWDTDQCLRPVEYDPNHLRWHPMLKYSLAHESLRIAYQNRARTLLDLLFTKECIDPLVDDLVKDLGPISEQASWAEIDRFLWNHHPRTTRYHRGTFFQQWIRGQRISDHRPGESMAFETDGFAERVQYFKDFLTPTDSPERGKGYRGWGYRLLERNARDLNAPLKPSIERVKGKTSLTFQCSRFKDHQGARTLGGAQWRIAPLDGIGSELTPLWQSAVLKDATTFTFPEIDLLRGRLHRVRARYVDDTGRASHWSDPVVILQTYPEIPRGLVVSEIMYHPANGGPEFIELLNLGKAEIDLSPLKFTKGILCDLSKLSDSTLARGERLVLTNDLKAFLAAYPKLKDVRVYAWDSGKLANQGEQLVLQHGNFPNKWKLRYDDAAPWPTTADGQGHSIERIGHNAMDDTTSPNTWRASAEKGGTPGR